MLCLDSGGIAILLGVCELGNGCLQAASDLVELQNFTLLSVISAVRSGVIYCKRLRLRGRQFLDIFGNCQFCGEFDHGPHGRGDARFSLGRPQTLALRIESSRAMPEPITTRVNSPSSPE